MALTAQQQAAIDLIATGTPYRHVAQEVGCELADLARWAGIPEYRQALEGARGHRSAEGATVLSGAVPPVVEGLIERLEQLADLATGAGKEADRINAAKAYATVAFGLLDRAGLGPYSYSDTTVHGGGADDAIWQELTDDELAILEAARERVRHGEH